MLLHNYPYHRGAAYLAGVGNARRVYRLAPKLG
jgi:hypothetical protein